MRPASRGVAKLAVVSVAAVALLGAGAAPAKAPPKPATVTVNDFYFGPSAVTIKRGATVKWTWSPLNTYPHDVHLKSAPAGLKQRGTYSTKTTATTGARFQHAFPSTGTYKFICTIHPTEMKLTVTVKR